MGRNPTPGSDFPYDILNQTAHRPWPLPEGPWIMTQSWHDLLFAHWAIDAALLRQHVPTPLALDAFDGSAWIGVIPFHMTNVAPRGVPSLPFVSTFAELNVRTYVTYGDKPGIYFFSLDAASGLAVVAARGLFRLPYYAARMAVDHDGGHVVYTSERSINSDLARFGARYWPVGSPQPPVPGSLEYFLTERYCLYVVDAGGDVHRLEIHHPPWPLQPAAAAIDVNTMIDAAGIPMPRTPPMLHFSKRQDMVAWPMSRVSQVS